MDFDLFGPSAESPSAQPSVQPTPQAAPTAGGSPTATPVVPTLGAEQLQQLMLQMLNNQNTALQQQQNQMNFLMQAQSAQLTLLTRRFDEEGSETESRRSSASSVSRPFCCCECRRNEVRRPRRRQWHLRVFLPVQVLALVQLRVLVVVQRSTCHPCRSSIMVR